MGLVYDRKITETYPYYQRGCSLETPEPNFVQLQGCMQQEVQMCTVRYALLSNVWRMPRN